LSTLGEVVGVSQLNIHMTAAFEKSLAQFMRARGIKTKSEAIRPASRAAPG
jgi:hypothetical protein